MPPGSLNFTALSIRLATADTSWRRSPMALRSASTARHRTRRCRAGRRGGGCARRPRATTARTSTTPCERRSPSSMRDSSSRSSMVRADPVRLHRPSARSVGARPPGRRSSTRASASTASAPTGVFSSWLMLATKSVRTASRRAPLGDVVDRRQGERRRPAARPARQQRRCARRPDELERRACRRRTPAATRRREQASTRRLRAARASWPDERRSAALVADLRARRGDRPSTHAGAQRVERGAQPVALGLRRRRRVSAGCPVALAAATSSGERAGWRPTTTSRRRSSGHRRAGPASSSRRVATVARSAPLCSGSQPVIMNCTRSPMFTAWSPMRS